MKPEDVGYLRSDLRDEADADVRKEMTKAAVARLTFEQAVKAYDEIEDTPAHRRIYAVKLHNVGLMMDRGIQVDIPY